MPTYYAGEKTSFPSAQFQKRNNEMENNNMRYYIYQLFENPKLEKEWNESISFDFQNPPVPYAAFISPVLDRTRVLTRLRRWLKLYGLGDLKKGCMILHASAKKKYFKYRFAAFQDALQELSAISLDEFITDADSISKNLYKLDDSFLSTSDCHFLLENGTLIPIDQFMRSAEAKKPYYIGSALEFHYVNPECL